MFVAGQDVAAVQPGTGYPAVIERAPNIRTGEDMKERTARFTSPFLCIVIASSSGLAAAQDKTKRPSPPAKATCSLPGGKSVTVDYSSPRMKGRKIFGALVPTGKVWRLGANEATSLVTTTDLTIGAKTIPAGSYTLFAIPNSDKWTLIISKKTGEWGIPYPGEAEDLARVDMKVSKLPSPVENFTIRFEQAGNACTMQMDWETTRASIAMSGKK